MDLDARLREALLRRPGLDDAAAALRARLSGADASGAHDADLLLAIACARGSAAAMAIFEREQMIHVPMFLARLQAAPTFVDDVSQILREKLFTSAPPKIVEYSGTGPLGAWLRVTALRAAIDLKRTRGEQPSRALGDDVLADASIAIDVAVLKAEYRPAVDAAFREAVGTLTSKERNLLRLHLVDGLTLEEIGQLFSVNRSTTFRWLETARDKLVTHARGLLQARLGVDAAEFESLVQLVRSGLDLSLSRILRV